MPLYGWGSVADLLEYGYVHYPLDCDLWLHGSRVHEFWGRHLSDSVVNSHEVGILRKLGDDFSRAYSLSLTCYRRDRHEALFRGSVHPVGDLIEGLCEVPYREEFSETSAPFVALPVALTSGILVVVGFIGGCRQLVC
jgi:hypothetical protein